METTCAVSEQESPKKVKKLKVEKQDSAERPKVEVDFKMIWRLLMFHWRN